jgi:hypothetical protein
MEHTVRLGEFDDVESANTYGILDIMERLQETAPQGSKIAWTFPGYVSIVLENGTEIAFGDSLSTDTGYSWNDFDREGTNHNSDSFEDLGDINAIVNKLWEQTAPLTGKGSN